MTLLDTGTGEERAASNHPCLDVNNQVRETMGVADVQYTIDHFKSVFEHFPAVDAELSASQKKFIPLQIFVVHAQHLTPFAINALADGVLHCSVRWWRTAVDGVPYNVGTFSCGEVSPDPEAGSVKPSPVARSFF